MPFNWLDYIRLSDKLKENSLSDNLEEAIYRTVISRTYYATFNYSMNHAKSELLYDKLEPKYNTFQNKFSDSKANSHILIRYIFDFFHQQNSRIGYGTLSNNLNSLRELRNYADYDQDFNNLKDYINDVEDYAKEVIELIDSIDLKIIRKLVQNPQLPDNFYTFLKNKRHSK